MRYTGDYEGLENTYGHDYRSYRIDNVDKHKQHLIYVMQLATFIKSFSPKRILEIGCGTGEFYRAFNHLNIDYFGVELSKAALDMIEEKKNDRFFCSYGESLPFSHNFFDFVLLHHVVEHIPYPDDVIHECLRVICNKGFVVVVTSCPPFGSVRMWKKFGLFSDPDHVSIHTRKEWIQLFKKYGFQYLRNLNRFVRNDPANFAGAKFMQKIPIIGEMLSISSAMKVRGSFVFQLENKDNL